MENLAPKNVVITIEFTTNTIGVFCVSLALLLVNELQECLNIDFIIYLFVANFYTANESRF